MPQAVDAGTINPVPSLRFLEYFVVVALLTPAVTPCAADNNAAAVVAARAYVVDATRQYGTAVRVEVPSPPAGTRLPACARHEVFLPADTRLWGKTRVGIKCSEPTSWTAFLAVNVSVHGTYLVSARKINRGQVLTESDLETRAGDLTELPESTLTDLRLAVGQRAKISLAARQPLRRFHLQQSPVIRQGDKVRLVVRRSGFSASTEGVALNHAGEGEPIKVRISSGRTLSGIARTHGEVELPP